MIYFNAFILALPNSSMVLTIVIMKNHTTNSAVAIGLTGLLLLI
jgi:hypothetical protein